MRVDYLGLEAFVGIADYGSFHRAADALHLSQAALSHRVRKIEEDLGAPLFTRSSREVSLTPTGQELLPEARRLLKALQDTYESARAGAQRQARRLAFACLPSIAKSMLAKVLMAMAEDHPEIAFELLDIPVARIAEAVRSGAAEFGLTIVSAELSDLRLRPLVDEEYRLFVHRDHPFAAKDFIDVREMEGVRLARIRTHSKNSELLDLAFANMRDRMHWQFEVQNATMAMRLAAQGAAMTIQPESAIAMAPATLVSVPIAGIRLQRTLGVVSRRGVPLTRNATELLGRIEADMLENFRAHVASGFDRVTRPKG